jgi:preprotein translocase subunit SecE
MATASEASQSANRSGMDPKRLVVVFYLVAGIVFALFLDRILVLAWDALGFSNREVVEGMGWTRTGILGVLLSLAIAVFCYMNPKVRSLSLETATELMRVTWPSVAETRVSTVAVVIASLVSAVILYGIDIGALHLMVDWLPALWGKL